MIDPTAKLSVSRQAIVLGISRGSVYYKPRPVSDADLKLMHQFTLIIRMICESVKRFFLMSSAPSQVGQTLHLSEGSSKWRVKKNRALISLTSYDHGIYGTQH